MAPLAKLVPYLNGPSWQSRHGKICKMQLENFDQVLSYIEFVGKTLKTNGKY
jgi:hypothetical protein